MFDAHRHLPCSTPIHADALYATSTQGEWQDLFSLPVPCLKGVGVLGKELLPVFPLMEDLLFEHADVQIAEVGLDKRMGDREEQQTFLIEVLALAYKLKRSVSLHCVQSDGMLLSLLESRRSHLPQLLWHGCTLSWESAKRAADLGIILSFGPSLFGAGLARRGKELLALPYALETDFTGSDEHQYAAVLTQQYRNFALLTGASEQALIRNNDEIRTILAHHPLAR